MTDRELMQQALDALEHLQTDIEWQYKSPTRSMLRKVEKALRAALAQPEQEPVAWVDNRVHGWPDCVVMEPDPPHTSPLYTAPPQREWQGFTDQEYEIMAEQYVTNCYFDTLKYAKAIETKLKEKNYDKP